MERLDMKRPSPYGWVGTFIKVKLSLFIKMLFLEFYQLVLL